MKRFGRSEFFTVQAQGREEKPFKFNDATRREIFFKWKSLLSDTYDGLGRCKF